jgi:hypothetical protein
MGIESIGNNAALALQNQSLNSVMPQYKQCVEPYRGDIGFSSQNQQIGMLDKLLNIVQNLVQMISQLFSGATGGAAGQSAGNIAGGIASGAAGGANQANEKPDFLDGLLGFGKDLFKSLFSSDGIKDILLTVGGAFIPGLGGLGGFLGKGASKVGGFLSKLF